MPELAFTLEANEVDRLDQAEAEVRGFCGWHIAPSKKETVTVEGSGGSVLLLPSLRVTDVESIRDEDGNEVTGYKWRTNGVVRGWWRCDHEYTVTFTHGYGDVPADVVGVVQALATMDPVRGVLQSKGIGPFSESYAVGERASTMQATLDRYKLPSRP